MLTVLNLNTSVNESNVDSLGISWHLLLLYLIFTVFVEPNLQARLFKKEPSASVTILTP